MKQKGMEYLLIISLNITILICLQIANLQSWTKHLTKVEKSSEVGLENKILISTFACFLTAIVKV